MILAVSLNPALDVTYELAAPLRAGATNRVTAVHVRAGGKALNVARVLMRLGHEVQVIAPCGGPSGQALANAADAAGITAVWIPVAGETRRTVAAWDRSTGEVTMLNEPGPPIGTTEWHDIVAAVEAVGPVEAVVLSGSLPPGLPDDAYRTLIGRCAADGVLTFLDTDGRGLLAGVAAHPTVVKPNRDELAAVFGETADLSSAAESLRALGAQNVVVSDGPRGLVGVTAHGSWSARPTASACGNPTGAGDACVAGLVASSVDGLAWPDRLALAAALGAVAAGTGTAADEAPVSALDRWLKQTVVEEL
ncbi:MAG: 1-phosphofructokinase family hexose kinase [Acidimicrobiia bacterium]|nr:1-phosphofructokinase family hexose kinase [Acidimicrobiia bacterium]